MVDLTQQERVRIDRIIFKKGLNKQYLKSQLGRANSLTDKPNWQLSDQKYALYQIQGLIDFFEQLEIYQLNLNRTSKKSSKIFKFIQISFPVLSNLSLCILKDYQEGNNIVSVESLAHLNAINLNTLWLAYNKIIHIRPLAKMFIPELEWLSLHNNPILEFQILQTLRAPKLQYIQFGKPLLGVMQSADMRWFLKLQTAEINPSYIMTDFKDSEANMMLFRRYL